LFCFVVVISVEITLVINIW